MINNTLVVDTSKEYPARDASARDPSARDASVPRVIRPQSAAGVGRRTPFSQRKNKKAARRRRKQRKGGKNRQKSEGGTFLHQFASRLNNIERGKEFAGDTYIYRDDVVYTGGDDVSNLQKKFQADVAYHTLPWNQQSDTSAFAQSKKSSPHQKPQAKDWLLRSASSPTQLAPLFDQWLVGPAGEQYKRQGKIVAKDFVEEMGKIGLLGGHDTKKL